MLQICKELQNWFLVKCQLTRRPIKIIFFKQRDIWWCSVGKNIGVESDGKNNKFTRPVLVLKKLNSTSFIGLPLTTKVKNGTWFQQITLRGKVVTVTLNQIRIFSTNRLHSRLARLDNFDFIKTKRALKQLLGL